ncbi:MAG: hypothetical protein JNM13_15825 [Hyphomicrobiaceae bacterium]|nr:hypothetical protein [Hyphomicrobiaceae bacterium]
MRWAIVDADGSVSDIIIWDGEGDLTLDPGQSAHPIPDGLGVAIGSQWHQETGFAP